MGVVSYIFQVLCDLTGIDLFIPALLFFFTALSPAAMRQHPTRINKIPQTRPVVSEVVLLRNGRSQVPLVDPNPAKQPGLFGRLWEKGMTYIPVVDDNKKASKSRRDTYQRFIGGVHPTRFWLKQETGNDSLLTAFIRHGPGAPLVQEQDGEYSLNLLHMANYTVRSGFYRYGCRIDLTPEGQILSITLPAVTDVQFVPHTLQSGQQVIPQGQQAIAGTYHPGETGYVAACRRAESTLLAYCTLSQHLLYTHLIISETLATVSRKCVAKGGFYDLLRLITQEADDIVGLGAEILIGSTKYGSGWFSRVWALPQAEIKRFFADEIPRFPKMALSTPIIDSEYGRWSEAYLTVIRNFVTGLYDLYPGAMTQIYQRWSSYYPDFPKIEVEEYWVRVLYYIWVMHPLNGDLGYFISSEYSFATKPRKSGLIMSRTDYIQASILSQSTSFPVPEINSIAPGIFSDPKLGLLWQQLLEQFAEASTQLRAEAPEYDLMNFEKLQISVSR